MAASKVVETVILGAGTLIVIYYAVTHQDQLKMYFDKFIMSAQSQLSGGGSTGSTTGANTSGSDNTPATTATTPAPTPIPAAPVLPTGPPTLGPSAPTNSTAPPVSGISTTTGVPSSIASTVLPPTQSAIDQTMMMQMMMQMQTDAAANQLANTITPVDPSLVNNTGMPSIVGQTPQTTTGRNMKMKMMMPRTQTAVQKKVGQIASAKQKGNVIVPASQAGPFCTCSKAGRWMGTGCNVLNKFCATAGQRGTGNQRTKVTLK